MNDVEKLKELRTNISNKSKYALLSLLFIVFPLLILSDFRNYEIDESSIIFEYGGSFFLPYKTSLSNAYLLAGFYISIIILLVHLAIYFVIQANKLNKCYKILLDCMPKTMMPVGDKILKVNELEEENKSKKEEEKELTERWFQMYKKYDLGVYCYDSAKLYEANSLRVHDVHIKKISKKLIIYPDFQSRIRYGEIAYKIEDLKDIFSGTTFFEIPLEDIKYYAVQGKVYEKQSVFNGVGTIYTVDERKTRLVCKDKVIILDHRCHDILLRLIPSKDKFRQMRERRKYSTSRKKTNKSE